MRIIHLNIMWTIIINFVVWFFFHMIIAFGATLLPVRLFNEQSWLFRIRTFEKKGKLYAQLFRVNKWKDLLPDGASWFARGFAKKNLKNKNSCYIDRFIKETCRGEFTHWIVLLISPVFFLFNIWYAGVIMIIYALIANIPCIIIQRFNRPRLIGIRRREAGRKKRKADVSLT